MGANQSNGTGSNSGGPSNTHGAPEVKTSYYELLGIEKTSTDEEIKKAYRRKALELHPDRNYGNIDRATALFADIQVAYEVLSDPQERAWYDTHEDAILRDLDPEEAAAQGAESTAAYERNLGVTSADEITRMMRRFGAGVEFTDEKDGFYGFLKDVFERLAKEELVAVRREGGGAEARIVEYPSFGFAEDEYEDVKGFYAAWAGFATRKSFAWRDKWRTAEAPDRRTRRYIEKENQHMRDEGIREFNDAVRTLVAFVRKRDPRYSSGVGPLRTEAEREKVLREAAAERARKMRKENDERMGLKAGEAVVPDWAKAELQEKEEHEGSVGDDGEESEEEQWECVACRKTFKSERQYEAHEKSKKHQKAVGALRKKMKKEGVQLDLDDDAHDGEEDQDDAYGDESQTSGAATPAVARDANINGHNNGIAVKPEDVDAESSPDDTDGEVAHAVQASMEDLHLSNDRAENDTTRPQHETRSETRSLSHNDNDDDESDDDDDDTSSDSDEDNEYNRTHQTTKGTDIPTTDTEQNNMTATANQNGQPKLGKAAMKRAKRAAAADQEASDEASHKCASCAASFPSRSRLFQHIKDHGHAAPVGSVGAKGKGAKKAKGGKK